MVLVTRLGFLCLVLSTSLANAQDFWEETPCASIGITENNINLNCVNFCAPFQAEIFSGLNTTGTEISKVLSCKCPSDQSGCLDSKVIHDRTQPTPTCDSLQISAIEDCSPLCNDLGQGLALRGFRSVNGETSCRCADADICADDPTCAQLQVKPGTALEDCQRLCGDGVSVTYTDDVEFAGGPFVANKDQTHLHVSCTCGAIERCDDSILFSDLARIEGCRDDLGISADMHCQAYCEEFGFASAEYFTQGFFRNCTCSSDAGFALACEDDPQNPPPTDDNPPDDDVTSTSGSSSVAALITQLGTVVALFAFLS